MPQSQKTYDVFLSFNSKDRDAVRQIAYYLANEANLCPWFDEWDLVAGDLVVDKVYQGLEAVSVYAVFLGQQGEGPWQNPEIRNAVHNCVNDPQRRIIPVFLPDAPQNPVLPPFLKGYKWVDFRGKALDDPDLLRQLVEGIRQAAQLPLKPLSPPPEVLRTAYLNALFEQVSRVSLAQIDRKVAEKETERTLNLGAIYTALLTQTTEREHPGKSPVDPDSQDRRLSAVAQVNQHQRIVLLGDPGSGKSTFVNFVVMCLAGEWLGEDAANLARLRDPLPQDDGKDEDNPQPWEHGALLPVRIILRDFAAHALPTAQQPGTARHLWDFLTAALETTMLAADYAPALRQHLLTHGGFILLDGLDEVPESQRKQIKQVVEDFACLFPTCRMLVASRTYAYQHQEWQLQGFQQAVLAPFSDGQIRRFIDRWYGHVGVLRGMSSDNAQGRAELLKRAIFSTTRLHEFARRPLLLTLMASLHASRGGSLPEKREELYAEATELLLEWWERAKVVWNAEGQMEVVQESLSELLRVGQQTVRQVLESLAFQAHAGQAADRQDTADIPEKTLVNALLMIKQDKDLRPHRLVEYLSDRAGLLVQGRDGQSYTFPHRTFQEYLAACHLTAQDDDYPENIARLARQAPNRWREVLLLASAKAASGVSSSVWTLAEELCDECKVDDPEAEAEDAWGALLAAQALVEIVAPEKLEQPRRRSNRATVEQIRKWLAAILTEQAPAGKPFPAVERALAGRLLAKLGDMRPGVELPSPLEGGRGVSSPPGRGEGWVAGLPDIEWREIPAGTFLMGSDKKVDKFADDDEMPQHRVTLPVFKMSRYPMTNAQYQAFVDNEGYTEKWRNCWTDEGWKEKEENDWAGPRKFRDPFGFPNHPVVGVSWYEAMAFCNWLTEKLRKAGELQVTEVVRLPSEAEWEYAARGPESYIYPWGNDAPQPEWANYRDTNLGENSAVGCFPCGKSRFSGCEDMAGNVWEWCLDSWYDDYQDAPDDGKSRGSKDDEKTKVLRGGSWIYIPSGCRCAVRLGSFPGYGYFFHGFRVVVGVART